MSLAAEAQWSTAARRPPRGVVGGGHEQGGSREGAEQARSLDNVDFASQPAESPSNGHTTASCTFARANFVTGPARTQTVLNASPSSSTSEAADFAVSFAAALLKGPIRNEEQSDLVYVSVERGADAERNRDESAECEELHQLD
ncbi:hypothetical protein JCM1841_005620 [Sporobolomyces salmonicolor]